MAPRAPAATCSTAPAFGIHNLVVNPPSMRLDKLTSINRKCHEPELIFHKTHGIVPNTVFEKMIKRSIALLTLNSRGLGRICGGISASNTLLYSTPVGAVCPRKIGCLRLPKISDIPIRRPIYLISNSGSPLSVTAGVTRSLERHIFRRRLVEGCVPEGRPNSYAGNLLCPRYTMSVHARSQYLTVAGIGVGTSAVSGRYPRNFS